MQAAQDNKTLTPRQIEVLDLVAKGLTNGEISAMLGISLNTVKVHLSAVFTTLHVANRAEAIAVSRQGLQSTTGSRAQVAERIGRPSIAVVPFRWLSSEPDDDHIAEGFTEDLITRLAGWRWFPIIGQASSRRFAKNVLDLEAARQEIGAAYVINGSIRRMGDRARVNAFLTDTRSGVECWSDTYEVNLADIWAAQNEAALRIVGSIAPELVEIEGQSIAQQNPNDFGAWQQTMLGLWLLARRNSEDVSTALVCFQSAIEKDPDFSLSWYGKTWAHHHRAVEQWSADPATELTLMGEAAETCYQCEPNSSSALTVMGLREMVLGERQRTLSYLEQATELNPSSTRALSLLGQCYCMAGRADECIAALEEAVLLSPYNPNVWAHHAVIGLAHFTESRFDAAMLKAEQALVGRPDMITAHLVMLASLWESGDQVAAIKWRTRLQKQRAGFDLDSFLGLIAPSSDAIYVDRLRDAYRGTVSD